MNFRLLAPAFLVLALFIAGCPSLQPVTFANTDATDSYIAPSDCASCACLVCQRPELTDPAAIDDISAPTGISKDYLAKSGGGLAGSRCWFQTCGAKLEQQIKEDRSLYQVPFKISAGQDVGPINGYIQGLSSWQFRQAAKYCPMTDKWCGFAAPGTKDRWQNVLRSYGFDAFLQMQCNSPDPPRLCNYGTGSDDFVTWSEDPVKSASPTIPQFEWMSDSTYVTSPDDNAYVADHSAQGYPFPMFDNGVDSAFAGKVLPKTSDLLCLFQGPYDIMTASGSKYYGAPSQLFCASGNCNKVRTYESYCRKDEGAPGLDYSVTDPDNPQDYLPIDSTDCRCRTVRFYNEENALNYPSALIAAGGAIGFTNGHLPDGTAKDILPGGSQQWCRAYPANLANPQLTGLFYPDSGIIQDGDKIFIWNSLGMASGTEATDYMNPNTDTIDELVNADNLPVFKNCATAAKPIKGECAAYYEDSTAHTISIVGSSAYLDDLTNPATYTGKFRYCIDWAITEGGECVMTEDERLDLLEYGLCEGCFPTMDLVPIGGTYWSANLGDFGTNLVEDIKGEEISPPEYAHSGFLQLSILPVVDTRVWATDAQESIAKPTMVDQEWYSFSGRLWREGATPVVIVLGRNRADMAPLIKQTVLSDPADPNSTYGNCPPFVDPDDGITKQSCLVGVEDSWKIGTDWNIGDPVNPWASTKGNDPIPAGYGGSVDLLVADVTLTTCVSDAQFGDVLQALIRRAKDVQSIHADKPLGWLLYLRFLDSGCDYATDKSIGAIDLLANAGYIGVIATFADPPAGDYSAIKTPYDVATFNTLLHTLAAPDVFSNQIDITADPNNQAFYNFFLGCGNYYNGTKERYYVKQNPSVCQCQFCTPGETCTDAGPMECKTTGIEPTPDIPTSTGLQCLGPTLEKIVPPQDFKCSPGCVPFPIPDYSEDPEKYNTNAFYGLQYDCINGADSEITKQTYGCYAFCNVKVKRNAAGEAEVESWNRGLVKPQPGYNSPDATGKPRFTPTNCYMFDETTGSFYIYKELLGGNPLHRSYPIFDAQGKDNACGLSSEDLATFLAEQSADQAMPSIVVR